MDLESLKAIQSPIKEKYKHVPESALVELRAKGKVDIEEQHCHVDSFLGKARAGLHPAAGGSSSDACSAEMLLESLVACAGVTLAAVATNMSLKIQSCSIEAVGMMDFRGTLGVDRTAPVGLTQIELRFSVDTSESKETIEKLISLTERYCVIYQTLRAGVKTDAIVVAV